MKPFRNASRSCLPALIVILLSSLPSSQTPALGQSADTIRWQDPVVIATGPAHVGPWRMNDSEFLYVDDASPALRNDGEAVVAWVDNQRRDVFLQRFSPENQPRFEAPVNISRTPNVFSWLPRAVFTDENHVYVAWQEIVFSGGSHGGEIFFARSTDGGASFESPLNLSNTINGAGKGRVTKEIWDNGSLDLALGSDGTIVVAWTEYQGPLRNCRSTDEGQSFTEPARVAGSPDRPARAPSLAFGPGDAVYLAWTVGQHPRADIHLARSQHRGQDFATLDAAEATPSYADTPCLAASEAGPLHLVYAESSQGFFGPSQLRYLQLDNGLQPLGTSRLLAPETGGLPTSRAAPTLALGSPSHVFVLWEHHLDPGRPARGLGFAWSSNGGRSFSHPIVAPGSIDPRGGVNGSRQGELGRKLAATRSGHLAVTNSHFLQDQHSRIILIRGQVKARP